MVRVWYNMINLLQGNSCFKVGLLKHWKKTFLHWTKLPIPKTLNDAKLV